MIQGRVVGTVQDVVQGAYSAWNPSEFRGSSFISKKRQVSLRISQLHIGHHLFAPYLLLFLMDFSQARYCWKAIFKENPMLYVTKGEDYSLWKTSAIAEIAPLGSSWRQLVYIQSGLILSGHFPLRLGCFSFIFHCWESSLVWISGRNMCSTSGITRVWDRGIVDRLCRLKLALEVVVEDANKEIYSLEIWIFLIDLS